MQAATKDFLLITYREDLEILFLRWGTPVPSPKLRSGYLNALEEAEKRNVRLWLFDLRSRGVAAEADENWLLSSFFPLAEQKLGHHNAFAYLVSPSHLLHIRTNVGLQKLASFRPGTSIRVFISEGEAIQWLALQRQSLQIPA